MSKSKDENNRTETYTPLMFKHVDSLAKINNNNASQEKDDDAPPAPFPHVDSLVLLGAVNIVRVEGAIDGGCSSPKLQQNSDSSG